MTKVLKLFAAELMAVCNEIGNISVFHFKNDGWFEKQLSKISIKK